MWVYTEKEELINLTKTCDIKLFSHNDSHHVYADMNELFSGTKMQCEQYIYQLGKQLNAIRWRGRFEGLNDA